MSGLRWSSAMRVVILAAIAVVALPAASASAGRLLTTGHDVEDHCSNGDQCHYMKVATKYVRGGAPNPSKQVLLLDCSTGVRRSLDNAFGTGDVPRTRICPSDTPGQFNNLELSTKKFSAIIVGSSCDDSTSDGAGDNSLNLTEDLVDGCDEPGGSTPDSDLINARKGDIKRFFNKGGGIFAMSGGVNGDGDPASGPDVYYDFLPLGAQGVAVNPPFCLTNRGIELGFHDQQCPDASKHNGTQDDINCCETHNSFAEPEQGGALKVAERDSEGFAETLFADAIIAGGGFVEDNTDPRIRIRGLPDGCTRDDFRIRVRIRDESDLRRAKVLLDGKVIKQTDRKRFRARIPAQRLVSGEHRIKVVAKDTAGNRNQKVKTFRRCPRPPRFTG